MNNDFCCQGLRSIINDPDCPLKYNAYSREFFLTAPDHLRKKKTLYPNYEISYCPRCGTKLPEDLFDKWYDIMKKEFGLEGLIGQDHAHLIPKEFRTCLHAS